MNEKWQKTFVELNRYSPSLECTCKVLPPNVKKYIKERCGAKELSTIIHISDKIQDLLKHTDDILEKLGID